MKRPVLSRCTIVFACTILMAASLVLAQEKSAERLLQDGINKETIDRDFDAAIALYEQAFNKAGANPRLAAEALLSKGMAYKKSGNQKARATLERVANDFKNQPAAVQARKLLDSMSVASSASTLKIHPVASAADADRGASISADGHYLVRQDGDTGDLIVRDMISGTVRHLFLKNGSGQTSSAFASNAMPSPNGQLIVYMWYPGDDKGANNYELRIVENSIGANPTNLLDDSEYCCFGPVGWSPDGRSILLTVSRPDGTWDLAWVSLADKKLKLLKSLGWRLRKDRPALSPDGKYVAYSALEKNPASALGRSQKLPATVASAQLIYVLPTDKSADETVLGVGGDINESPVWTGDGKHILFVSNRSTGFGLYSISVENGAARGVPYRVPEISGRISPIGMTRFDTLYYVPENKPGGFDVFVSEIDRVTGKIRGQATGIAAKRADWNRAPSWSPDDKLIAFKRQRSDSDTKVFDLVVYNLATKDEKKYEIAGLDNSRPIWFQDSKHILLQKDGAPRLIRLDLDTKEFVSIEPFAHSVLPLGFEAAVVSGDDHKLYMAVAPPVSEQLRQSDPKVRVISVVTMDLVLGRKSEIWRTLGPMTVLHNLALSPNGQALAMTVSQEGWDSPHLIRIGVDGTGYKDIAASVSEGMFTWTRDSRSIFFAEVSAEKGRIMKVLADGTGRPEPMGLVLSEACACDHTLDFNPDGSRLVFSDSTRETMRLWALDNVSTILRSAR